jgi:hypothetical protein
MRILVIIQNGTVTQMFNDSGGNDLDAIYHTELAYRHESRTSTTCFITDEYGNLIKRETYIRNE